MRIRENGKSPWPVVIPSGEFSVWSSLGHSELQEKLWQACNHRFREKEQTHTSFFIERSLAGKKQRAN
jgi:hypothetical protein